MYTYLAIFTVALCSSIVLTPLIRRLGQRLGWMDVPSDTRRVHETAIPRIGGIAIVTSLLISISFLPFVDNLVTQALKGTASQWVALLVPATLVFCFGIYDDLKGANAPLKFIALGLAGALFYLLGGRIDGLSIPFLGSVQLPPVIGFVLTIVWVVGISNAFNLIDGVDGLATGAALFGTVVLVVVSLMMGQPLITIVGLALCGALVGFLRYNFNPASIFLGDSGALFVGFLLAALSIQGAIKAPTAIAVAIPMIAFGLPVVDTGFTLIRRFLSRRPLFQGDREHIHHMLLARGWSQRRVVIVLYGVCAAFGLLALLCIRDTRNTTGLVLFIVGMTVVLAAGHLRYHEVDEIRASMKRNLADRRVRAANNIRVRRASRTMSKAINFDELFAAVAEMLEHNEFVYARVEIGLNGYGKQGNGHAARGVTLEKFGGAEQSNGTLRWFWTSKGIDENEVMGSDRFWVIRLPLSSEKTAYGYINLYRQFDTEDLLLDINYLCDLFRRETTEAIGRILNPVAQPSETARHSRAASTASI